MHTRHLMKAIWVEDKRTTAGKAEKQGGKLNIPISHASNGALLELHHVASERSCLVREDVFHLKGKRKSGLTPRESSFKR